MTIMTRFRTLTALALTAALLAGTPLIAQQVPEEPLEGFVPIDQLPPTEQLPAAPLLVAAYAFAWLAVFFYLWTVWRRLNRVEAEMRTLERRQAQGNR
jgi:CcmD family protein